MEYPTAILEGNEGVRVASEEECYEEDDGSDSKPLTAQNPNFSVRGLYTYILDDGAATW